MPKRHRKKSTKRVDGYLVEHVKGYVRDEPVRRHHKRRKARKTVY
jgi:hypothetical protein